MSERDFFLWGAFAAFFIAISVEILLLRARVKKQRDGKGAS